MLDGHFWLWCDKQVSSNIIGSSNNNNNNRASLLLLLLRERFEQSKSFAHTQHIKTTTYIPSHLYPPFKNYEPELGHVRVGGPMRRSPAVYRPLPVIWLARATIQATKWRRRRIEMDRMGLDRIGWTYELDDGQTDGRKTK